jgi:hypothetical protein
MIKKYLIKILKKIKKTLKIIYYNIFSVLRKLYDKIFPLRKEHKRLQSQYDYLKWYVHFLLLYISNTTHRVVANSKCKLFDDEKHKDFVEIDRKLQLLSSVCVRFGWKIVHDFSEDAYCKALDLFEALTPMNVIEGKKKRLGGANDCGYVMLEPEIKKNQDGIAYSFGISTEDPWSLEMVNKGYHVFQYDGTIDKCPYAHPMIHFYKFMITGSRDTQKNEKNLEQIFQDHSHQMKMNIILKIDIEGAEWEFFESLTKAEILHFEQIIVEFHWFSVQTDDLLKKIAIIKKINETHQCIHLHANNCGPVTILNGFRLLPSVMEASYVRKKNSENGNSGPQFIKCCEEFPGELDFSNEPGLPDIYLGHFAESNDAASAFNREVLRTSLTNIR